MTSSLMHVIKKQIIQLNLHPSQDAFRMQQLVSAHFWKTTVPLLERAFDELSPGDEVWHIDRLEIDLGRILVKDVEHNTWSEQLTDKIGEAIREKLMSSTALEAHKESVALNSCRQWLFYMQNGYLPWNTRDINADWKNKVLEVLATDYSSIAALRELIRSNSPALRRMVSQHNTAFLVKLVEILTAENQGNLPLVVEEIFNVLHFLQLPAFESKKEGERQLWLETLTRSALTERGKTPENIIANIYGRYLKHPDAIQAAIDNLSPKLTITQLKQVKNEVANIKEEKSKFERQTTMATESENQGQNSFQTDENQPGNLTAQDQTRLPMIDEDGLYVHSAGLVLLHPFLTSFFKRLQMVDQGKFKNFDHQQKALYLLHYLATRNTDAEEYELAVPKILCSWPLEMPVEKEIIINHEESSEAENLLEAAIQQWEILKNTSVDGLREGFLQRNGKFFIKNNNLHLQVETSAIDVLLDYLPWNLSMIKLPWMKELLKVEWR